MTDNEKRAIRERTVMRAFTFYLDDVTKLFVMRKLRENGLDTKKGTFSSLIRVLLSNFAELSPDDPMFVTIAKQINEEYLFTAKKNKRSTM